MRRIPRGDVHRRGGAALIGKHGRKIFPLVRRRPATPLRDSPFRGEAREDRSGPSGRKGEQHHRRGAPPPSVTERWGCSRWMGCAGKPLAASRGNEGGAEALPPPRFKPNWGSCLIHMPSA